MKFTILTLFPKMIEGYFNESILKRAKEKGLIEIKIVNIRDYTKDKYFRTDTPPVGGGAGLIMKCQPIIDALKANSNDKTYKIIMSPRGRTFNQKIANEFKDKYEDILILCGHYEGIDERVYSFFDEEISIGDYILTGGEAASIIIVDSVSRLINGVIKEESIEEETFNNNLLEYPQYTEPFEYEGKTVPNILYSGNHEAIKKWRKKESLRLTKSKRPDLFSNLSLSKTDIKLLNEIEENIIGDWETKAIEKGKKFTK